MQAHLLRLTWQPGWTFDLYEGFREGPLLRIAGPELDATNPDRTIDLALPAPVPPMDSLAQFETWLWWRLKRQAIHEACEWFKRDGHVVFDPHAPDAHWDLP